MRVIVSFETVEIGQLHPKILSTRVLAQVRDDVGHLVRETRAERHCVVGWFRERWQVPAGADLAQTLRCCAR